MFAASLLKEISLHLVQVTPASAEGGVLAVSYTGTGAGSYTIVAKYNRVHLARSPCTVVASTAQACASLCEVRQAGDRTAVSEVAAVAGEPMKLLLHAKDADGTLKCVGGDLFAVDAVAPDGGSLAGRVEDHQNGIYTAHLACMQVCPITNNPTRPTLCLSLAQPQPPTPARPSPPTSPHTPSLRGVRHCSIPLGFDSSCTVRETRTQPATHADKHNTLGDGFVWAALSQVGVHRVTVSLKGQPVAGSPFTATVAPACVCASTSVLYGEDHGNSSIRASQTASLLIQPFDAFRNGVALEDFGGFSVSATGPGDAVVKRQPGGQVSPHPLKSPNPNHRAL